MPFRRKRYWTRANPRSYRALFYVFCFLFDTEPWGSNLPNSFFSVSDCIHRTKYSNFSFCGVVMGKLCQSGSFLRNPYQWIFFTPKMVLLAAWIWWFRVAARGKWNCHTFVGLGLELWIKSRKILHTFSNPKLQGLGLEFDIGSESKDITH